MKITYVLVCEKWENDVKTGRLLDYKILEIYEDRQDGWNELQRLVVGRAAEEKAEHWTVGRVDNTLHSVIEGKTHLGKDSTPIDHFDFVWKLYPVPVP